MSKSFHILFLLFITVSCCTSINLYSQSFDKKKWLTSSEYRYNIAKSENFPDLKGKSKVEVKKILGNPDNEYGDKFIYCFDLNSVKYYNQDLKRENCECKGSFVIIDFKIDDRWRTTFFW